MGEVAPQRPVPRMPTLSILVSRLKEMVIDSTGRCGKAQCYEVDAAGQTLGEVDTPVAAEVVGRCRRTSKRARGRSRREKEMRKKVGEHLTPTKGHFWCQSVT